MQETKFVEFEPMLISFLLRHLRLVGVCNSFQDIHHCRSWPGASVTATDSQIKEHGMVDTCFDIYPVHPLVDKSLPELKHGVLGPKLEDLLCIVCSPGMFNLLYSCLGLLTLLSDRE